MDASTVGKDTEVARDAVTDNELMLPLPQLVVLTPAQTKAVAGGGFGSGCPACGLGGIVFFGF
jgi:hypothetical protein